MSPGSLDSLTEPVATEDGKNLWSGLLKEVTHKASVKLPSCRALIVLGDDECGKTTLTARLQGMEDPKKSYGLEYAFIDVKDEERDDQTKLNVWILDGDPVHSHLLKFALHANNFGECMVMIIISMAEPWNAIESLEKWTDVLTKHILRLSIPKETLEEYKSGLIRQFREYVEPDSLSHLPPPTPVSHAPIASVPINSHRVPTKGMHPATAALLSSSLAAPPPDSVQPETEQPDMNDGGLLLPTNGLKEEEVPLEGQTLSENLGIPLVVVVTKTDAMNGLEKEDLYTEEHFDFIQMHIRRFCLRYGAALFYASVKEDKNCDLLNRYLQSRIYGFQFTQSAYVVERDCIFVPTGWDSEKKIGILAENFTQFQPTDKYNDIIQRPHSRKPAVRDPEVTAPDEQTFLNRLLANLQREGNQAGVGTAGAPNATGPIVGITSDSTPDPLLGNASPSGVQGAGLGRVNTSSPRPSSTGVRGKPSPTGSSVLPGTAVTGSGGIGAGGNPASRPSEGVLATFFTSLLNKKSTNPGTPPPPGSTLVSPAQQTSSDAAVAAAGMSPSEMQSELERLVKNSKEAGDTPSKSSTKSESDVAKPTEQPIAEQEKTTAEPSTEVADKTS